jgi:predicted MFS family arabinose efflux permease
MPKANSRVLLVVAFLLVFAPFGAAIPVLTSFTRGDGGLSPALLGLVLGIDSLSSVIVRMLIASRLARLDLRTLMIAASVAVAAGGALSVATGEAAAAMTGRFVAGAGQGVVLAAAPVWMSMMPAARGRIGSALGGVGAASYGGTALGVSLGAAALQAGSGLAAIVLLAGLPLLGAVLTTVVLLPRRDSGATAPRTPPSTADVVRATLPRGSLLMLIAVSYALVNTQTLQLGETREITGTAAAVTVFGLVMVTMRLFAGDRLDSFASPGWVGLSCLPVAAGAGLYAFSHTLSGLIAGAVLIGIGMSLTYPLLTVLTAAAHPHLRVAVVGFFGTYTVVGFGVGSWLLGLFRAYAGAGAPALAAAVCAVAAAVLAIFGGRRHTA